MSSYRHEMWHWSNFRPVIFALILIWAGLIWLADSLHWFPFRWWHSWGFFLTGAGVIFLFGGILRNLAGSYRNFGGSFFFGIIFVIIGLGIIIGWHFIWPVILIAIGLFIVLKALARKH